MDERLSHTVLPPNRPLNCTTCSFVNISTHFSGSPHARWATNGKTEHWFLSSKISSSFAKDANEPMYLVFACPYLCYTAHNTNNLISATVLGIHYNV